MRPRSRRWRHSVLPLRGGTKARADGARELLEHFRVRVSGCAVRVRGGLDEVATVKASSRAEVVEGERRGLGAGAACWSNSRHGRAFPLCASPSRAPRPRRHCLGCQFARCGPRPPAASKKPIDANNLVEIRPDCIGRWFVVGTPCQIRLGVPPPERFEIPGRLRQPPAVSSLRLPLRTTRYSRRSD